MPGTCIPTLTAPGAQVGSGGCTRLLHQAGGLLSPSPSVHPPRIPTATSGPLSRWSKCLHFPDLVWSPRSHVREIRQLGLRPSESSCYGAKPGLDEVPPNGPARQAALAGTLPTAWQERMVTWAPGAPEEGQRRHPRGGVQFPPQQCPPGDIPSPQASTAQDPSLATREDNAGQSRKRETEMLASPPPLALDRAWRFSPKRK